MRPWRIICAPLDCAGEDEGEARAPAALLAAGLARAAGTEDVVSLPTAVTSAVRDPATGVIGVEDVARAGELVRVAVADALAEGTRPLVVGGDCALVPGILAAAGDVRLAFVDGHLDALDGTTSPTGEAADMDLAVLTGHGPAALVPADARVPIVAPSQIVAVGFRGDVEPDVEVGDRLLTEADLVDPGVRVIDAAAFAALGPEATAREIGGPAWLHLDVDVIDESEMPAVSYPQPGGPSVAEIAALVRALGPLAGAHVMCFNPDRDPDGVCAARIVALVAAFQ